MSNGSSQSLPSAGHDGPSSAADLFGHVAPEKRTTHFGGAIDALARERGAWPSDALVYALEVINDRTAVKMLGGIPAGWDHKGWPVHAKKATEYTAVATLLDYRAAAELARSEGQ